MYQICSRSWRLCWAGLGPVGTIAACLLIFFYQFRAEAADQSAYLVTPDQYNACKDYFNKLTWGFATSVLYDSQETYTVNLLCEGRPADLSLLAENRAQEAAALGAPPADTTIVKTLRAEFVEAVVKSKVFEASGYDRVEISGAIIDGDLNLSTITINNALILKNVQFLGNVDFSYSSTKHNLDISGKLSQTLCLKGMQTDASIVINKLDYQPSDPATAVQSFDPASFITSGSGAPIQNSTTFCTDTTGSPSIGLQGARVGGQLRIRNTVVETIDAEGAQITGQVLIQNSTISESVNFSAATAGGFLFLEVNSPSKLKEDSQCKGSTVFLEGTDVKGSAEFVRSDLCGISMTGSHVSKDVNLVGSRVAFFDFSGSNAEGDLQIGPSRGPPKRLSTWLPAFGNRPNLVLSHSSVALVRVALNNWPNMCEIGVRSEDRKGKCWSPSMLRIDFCTGNERPQPRPLADSDDHFISIRTIAEWTGFNDLAPWLNHSNSKEEKDEPLTIVTDFRFKGFGKPFYCAWEGDALHTDGYSKSDYIFDDLVIDENKVELWLASTQYSPAEYQLISDLLVTNGQSLDAKKIGYSSKIIETRQNFRHQAWAASFTMLISRWINGYGYYPHFVIFWAIFFFVIGAWVVSSANLDTLKVDDEEVPAVLEAVATSGWYKYVWGPYRFSVVKYKKDLLDSTNLHKRPYGEFNPFRYSFEALLPIIKLSELHYEIELGGWRHYYFYFHRLVGWMLGIFVVGFVSGLVK
jgi:hypothetical protein